MGVRASTRLPASSHALVGCYRRFTAFVLTLHITPPAPAPAPGLQRRQDAAELGAGRPLDQGAPGRGVPCAHVCGHVVAALQPGEGRAGRGGGCSCSLPAAARVSSLAQGCGPCLPWWWQRNGLGGGSLGGGPCRPRPPPPQPFACAHAHAHQPPACAHAAGHCLAMSGLCGNHGDSAHTAFPWCWGQGPLCTLQRACAHIAHACMAGLAVVRLLYGPWYRRPSWTRCGTSCGCWWT